MGAIVPALNDASLHGREMGIYAFWATAEKSPKLSVSLLKDEDVRIRRSAVTANARSSPLAARVVPELTAALTDNDAAVRAGTACPLGNTWPPPTAAVPALQRRLKRPHNSVREAAAGTLREIDAAMSDAGFGVLIPVRSREVRWKVWGPVGRFRSVQASRGGSESVGSSSRIRVATARRAADGGPAAGQGETRRADGGG